MANAVPVLWSDDIKVDVVSPAAILRAQTGPLRERTKGILEAEITTESSDSGTERIHFDLVAPLLENYHHRILTASYAGNLVYPVTVDAECFDERHGFGATPDAATEQEFIELVGQVLQSREVRAVIQSLIARSNERGNGSSGALPKTSS